MDSIKLKKWIFLLSVVVSGNAFGGLYVYSDLTLKNYEEMNKMVQEKVDEALSVVQREEDEDLPVPQAAARDAIADQKASEILRDALQLILSRPDKDNMVEKLIPDVRRQLKNINSYDYTLESIAGEAINALKGDSSSTKYKVTYLFVLENLMAELQPEIDTSSLSQKIFQKIRDAKINITSEVQKARRRRMFRQFSPSEVAEKVLNDHFKRRDQKAKNK